MGFIELHKAAYRLGTPGARAMSGRAGSAFRGKNFGYPYCQRIKHKKVQRARLNWRALRLMRIRINRHPSERTAPRSRAPKWFPLRAAGTRAVIRPLGAHSLAFVVGAVGRICS
ncbi:unnamed protein product [Pieris brassicae]|uniref:Uncharacterized protein n=1 Tax=Pieris brassicae TaxID=7116 RepID=A0A9P0X7W0_PIEBR|nr:unnamed protein product [Pieris brassicae]